MMALDAKAIKEEIPDKDTYDVNSRRTKGKDQCRTPDSPEGARAIAPHSPISPVNQHTLILPRTDRNGSSPPIGNGNCGPTTPPPGTPGSISVLQDTARALIKIKRFLGTLVQFGQDSGSEIGDRVRTLILSCAGGTLTAEEFKIALQEITNFPLRQSVLPFLRSHIPLLQREISTLARASNQSTFQYVRANENSVIEYAPANSSEHSDIFLPVDGGSSSSSSASLNGNSHSLKRRGSENFLDPHHNGQPEWNDYILPSKRPYQSLVMSSGQQLYPSHPPFFDYQHSPHTHPVEQTGNIRDDHRSVQPEHFRNGNRTSSSDEEWKSIHTMLSCISGMVEKTKRAITILQQRGTDTQPGYPDVSLIDIKRQTEEKVAEFRRTAEDAVNQVKRQAVIEIQRAVSAAENRAVEIMAQERLKMEKFFVELTKTNSETVDGDNTTGIPESQKFCWNCGRKATETCSGCNLARYCSALCQHKGWEHHQQVCGTVRVEPPLQSSKTIRPSRSSPLQPQINLTNGLVPSSNK